MDTHADVRNRHPLLVGLTGGMGCGKTTVLHLFEELGVPCFVADEWAAGYYQQADFLLRLRDLLGDKVFLPDGQVDKKAIADIVFRDREKLLALNALVHPRVMADFQGWAAQQVAPYVVIESAILYEYGLDKGLDKMLCVYVGLEERLRRLEQRDHATREELMRRMANQMPAEEKMDRADYVVLNYEGNPRQRQVAYFSGLLTNIKS